MSATDHACGRDLVAAVLAIIAVILKAMRPPPGGSSAVALRGHSRGVKVAMNLAARFARVRAEAPPSITDNRWQFLGILDPARDGVHRRQNADQLALGIDLSHDVDKFLRIAIAKLIDGPHARGA